MRLNRISKYGDNFLTTGLVVILVLLPFHAFVSSWAANNFGHLELFKLWKEMAMLTLLPVLIFIVATSRGLRQWLARSLVVRLYAIYILIHLASGYFAYKNHEVNKAALLFALDINLRFIGFFIISALIASRTEYFKKFWKHILLLPGIVVIGFGIIQKFLPNDFLRYFYGSHTIPSFQTVDNNVNISRIQSTLRGPNPLGAYLSLLTPSFLIIKDRKSLKYLLISLGIVALFFSYSRSGMIGFLLSSLIIVILSSRTTKHLKRAMLLSLCLFVGIGIWLVSQKESTIVQDTILHTSKTSTSKVSSNSARATAIQNGLNDIYHEPLGRGPGTAGPASAKNDKPARISENYYLQLGQEVGVIGLVIFIGANYVVLKDLIRLKKQPLPVILIASFVGITFINMLSHAWTDDTLSLIWWGFAGIALAPGILKSKDKVNVKK